MSRSVASIAVVLAIGLAGPRVASAELIFFTTGRALSVKAHRFEGDSIVLILRGGGQVVCPQRLVVRIAPDEVPRPDPPDTPGTGAWLGSMPRSGDFAAIIAEASAEHGVDPKLVHAVIQVESGYQPLARSPKGAMGLMQLMPETAERLSVANPYDPRANIDAGIRHLRSLLDRFEVSLALAAYNAGEAAVEKFNGIPPYAETRAYVHKVLRLAGLTASAR